MATAASMPALLTSSPQAKGEERKPLVQDNDSPGKPAKKKSLKGMDHILAIPSLDPQVREEGSFCPVVIYAKLYFAEALDVNRVRTALRDRLLRYPRFRSVARADGHDYQFHPLDIQDIPMQNMVQSAPQVKKQEDLDEFCSDLSKQLLPLDTPLWRAYVINDMDDGRSLLLWQVDHVLGDGEALVKIFMSLLDDDSRPKQAEKRPRSLPPSCFSCLYSAYLTGCALFNMTVRDQLPGDPDNKLKLKNHRTPGSLRSYATSDSLDLDEIKKLKETLPGTTVNDVLLTVATLTLRAYLEEHDPDTLSKKRQVRANFPISLRSLRAGEDPDDLGNSFSQGFFRFPLEETGPMQILHKVKQQTQRAKLSPEPVMRDKMLNMLTALPLSRKSIGNLALDAYGKVTAMLSNVVGPSSQVNFAGQPVEDIGFNVFAPLGMYLGFISYRGRMSCSISMHAENEPNPSNMSRLWLNSFRMLQRAAEQ
eukprot:TRINITY_DN3200_c0_g1_i1.p1 TRINITY_DN3200_c0_g1~~TRINITY_DN3200_c0_g1_i1.p1  ORF type:complete len:479 (-),score=104.98 TRINITY_DN3200_c0_g1_i1:489-1925(-)